MEVPGWLAWAGPDLAWTSRIWPGPTLAGRAGPCLRLRIWVHRSPEVAGFDLAREKKRKKKERKKKGEKEEGRREKEKRREGEERIERGKE